MGVAHVAAQPSPCLHTKPTVEERGFGVLELVEEARLLQGNELHGLLDVAVRELLCVVGAGTWQLVRWQVGGNEIRAYKTSMCAQKSELNK